MKIMKQSLISFYLWVVVLVDGCPYQSCSCYDTQIECQEKKFTAVPPLNGTTVDGANLMLDVNQITTIPADSLPKYLAQLSLTDNPIASIDNDAFDGSASTLTTLSFSKFRFTRIPDALQRLNNLKYFSISNSHILDWNDQAMKHIGPTVQTLLIESIDFNPWPSWTKYFSNLTVLSLQGGNVSSVADDALDSSANTLQELSLSQNNLATVPKTISKLKALNSLYLLNNKITNITWLPNLSKLVTLSLDYNMISDAKYMSSVLRSFSGSLSELFLEGNLLTEIPDLSFLEKVQSLDFSSNLISNSSAGSLSKKLSGLFMGHNSLTRIPVVFKGLPNVNELLLIHNAVTEIEDSDFSAWIDIVDLSYNRLAGLTDTSFPRNASIFNLNLESNPLAVISAHALDNLPRLQILNLENTKLIRLPIGLSSLVNLEYFYISSITGLVCTCEEKRLSSWILSRAAKLDGKCGETTIYDFFASYSPDCPD